MKQVCSFVRPVSNNRHFDVMNTQMRENCHDCGLFAVAYAAELVHGKDPCLAHFNTEMMRSHLIKCLEGHEMERFPLKRERRIGFGRCVKRSSTVDIYCTCRMPNNNQWSYAIRAPHGFTRSVLLSVLVTTLKRNGSVKNVRVCSSDTLLHCHIMNFSS